MLFDSYTDTVNICLFLFPSLNHNDSQVPYAAGVWIALIILDVFLFHLHSLQTNLSPVSLVEGVITLGISFISTSIVPQHFAECGPINVISVGIWTRLAVVNNSAQSWRLSLR